jgi:hypothetical protein
MPRPPMPQKKKLALLKQMRELMKRARALANDGGYSDFEHVRRQFDEDDALTLKVWATGLERDEIDWLCARPRREPPPGLKRR